MLLGRRAPPPWRPWGFLVLLLTVSLMLPDQHRTSLVQPQRSTLWSPIFPAWPEELKLLYWKRDQSAQLTSLAYDVRGEVEEDASSKHQHAGGHRGKCLMIGQHQLQPWHAEELRRI